MIDPVLRVLEDRRARIDEGASRGLAFSATAHLSLLFAVLVAVWLAPRKPMFKIAEGIAIPIVRGGAGQPIPPPKVETPPNPEPPKPDPPKPEPPKPPPPAPLIKPVKEQEKKGLTPLDAKTTKKPEPASTPVAAAAGTPAPEKPKETPAPAPTAGLALAPQGPGAPNGLDAAGDLYLAGVQRRIWQRWQAELRGEGHAGVTVSFVILEDGSVEEVALVQTSGSSLIDRIAQRAIQLAGPFSPLPKSLGKDRYQIHVEFRPTT